MLCLRTKTFTARKALLPLSHTWATVTHLGHCHTPVVETHESGKAAETKSRVTRRDEGQVDETGLQERVGFWSWVHPRDPGDQDMDRSLEGPVPRTWAGLPARERLAGASGSGGLTLNHTECCIWS